MQIRPLGDRVLVSRIEAESVTTGGLLVPDNAKEKKDRATVIAVGDGRVMDDGAVIPLDVRAGDLVLFGRYCGTEVEVDGKKLLMIGEDDVLAIIEP
jgi:chaperonin GroES